MCAITKYLQIIKWRWSILISYNKIFKALLILSLSVGGLNFINLKENNYIYAQNKTIYQNEDKKEEKGSKKNKDKVKKQI